jgi:hypothetical protein
VSVSCPGRLTHRKKIHHYPWIRKWVGLKPELDAAAKKNFLNITVFWEMIPCNKLQGLTSQKVVIFIFTIIRTSNLRIISVPARVQISVIQIIVSHYTD